MTSATPATSPPAPALGDLRSTSLHILGVFAALCASFFVAAHLFMPKAAYTVSASDFTVVDGPWRKA